MSAELSSYMYMSRSFWPQYGTDPAMQLRWSCQEKHSLYFRLDKGLSRWLGKRLGPDSFFYPDRLPHVTNLNLLNVDLESIWILQ